MGGGLVRLTNLGLQWGALAGRLGSFGSGSLARGVQHPKHAAHIAIFGVVFLVMVDQTQFQGHHGGRVARLIAAALAKLGL